MPKKIANPEELILKHASELISEEGYKNFNIRNVAERSGLSIGTIYNYFSNKNDLIAHLIEFHWEEFYSRIDEFVNGKTDFCQAIKNLYDDFVKFATGFQRLLIELNFQVFSFNDGRKKQNDFILRLIQKLADNIEQNYVEQNLITLNNRLSSKELSEFIVSNFIIMNHMNGYTYVILNKILSSIVVSK